MGEVILGTGKGRGKKRPSVICIEGETLTSMVIAARLGITESCFNSRYRKLKNTPGPMTWAKLRGRK